MPPPVLIRVAQWRGAMENIIDSSMDIATRLRGTSERLVGPHQIH